MNRVLVLVNELSDDEETQKSLQARQIKISTPIYKHNSEFNSLHAHKGDLGQNFNLVRMEQSLIMRIMWRDAIYRQGSSDDPL